MDTIGEGGRYQLLETLGEGGFATVYRAYDQRLNREVAVKKLHTYLAADPAIVARFRHEAAAAAKLDHPNIGVVFDWAESGDALYIVMRLIPGTPLDALLAERGAMPLDEALPILRQIAAALDYAHTQGLVHRDVKPSNVIIGARGQATLTDFGIAKLITDAGSMMTRSGETLGTPYYMAPEQADPDRAPLIGPATDQYALAVVAYQMLTGQVPFSGSQMSVMFAHVNQPPPDPRTHNDALPPTVVSALLRALSKAPDQRYPSVSAFVAALTQAADPVTARNQPAPTPVPDTTPAPVAPPPPRPIAAPPATTSRWPLGLLALLSVALLGVIGVLALTMRSRGNETAASATATAPVALATDAPAATRTVAEASTAAVAQDNPATATTRPATATTAPTATLEPTPLPAAGEGRTAAVDNAPQRFVPAGTFLMGDSADQAADRVGTQPQHSVTLDAFWMDEHEVTNGQYAACVADGGCQSPAEAGTTATPDYFTSPQFGEFPVINVSWDDAHAYCAWAGRRLPTEAEWERAARGDDTRLFPWGDAPASGERLNICDATCAFDYRDNALDDGSAEMARVGSYPAGASPFGILDLSGNVWEWVEDWYTDSYYTESPAANPPGPTSGIGKVHRGSGWDDVLRPITARGVIGAPDHRPYLGFRCAETP